MKRHLMLGTVFSAALAVGAAAQSQPPSQSPTSQPPTSQSPTSQDTSRSSSGTVTVTGCLKADTSSPSAAPGAPGAPASSASAGYILEASGSSSAASPTEKPSPTATSGTSSNTTYKLTGGSSDLASLVGKKVEVKGTVQKSAGGGAAAESRPGSSDMSKQQQLRVSSVKEVSGSCSQ